MRWKAYCCSSYGVQKNRMRHAALVWTTSWTCISAGQYLGRGGHSQKALHVAVFFWQMLCQVLQHAWLL